MLKKQNIFKTSFKTLCAFYDREIIDLRIGEKIVFILILSLFEERETIYKTDVIKSSRAEEMTTYKQLRGLQAKGLIKAINDSEGAFSPMRIELTEKGKLTASRLRRVIVS